MYYKHDGEHVVSPVLKCSRGDGLETVHISRPDAHHSDDVRLCGGCRCGRYRRRFSLGWISEGRVLETVLVVLHVVARVLAVGFDGSAVVAQCVNRQKEAAEHG